MKPVQTIVAGRQIVSVGRSTCTLEAARLMAANQVGALPVIDDDRLVGIVTERDIMARIVATNLDPATTPVGDVMSTDLLVADVIECCDVCLHRMQQAHVRHLIVLDHGHFAGIVALRDLLTVDVDEKTEAINLLNAYVHYVPAHLQGNAPTPSP
jgi:CBS domain-containing protein